MSGGAASPTPSGLCGVCNRPLDDHAGAAACSPAARRITIRPHLKFENGICAVCCKPRDDHDTLEDGLRCPRK